MTREKRNKQQNINMPEKKEAAAEDDDSRDISNNAVRAAKHNKEGQVSAVRVRKKTTIFTYPLPLHHTRYRAERNCDGKAVESIFETPENQLTLSSELQVVDCFEEIYRHISFHFPGRKDSILAHYNPLVSVPQFGNTCGFVALSMASQMFRPVGAKKLFEEAKSQGLTLIGEMFDAHEMASFATKQLDCEAKVICNLDSSKYDMLSHICDGWPVLIAYDQVGRLPVVEFGERAHWAVLSGLFLNVSLTVDAGRQLRMITTTKGDRVKERLRLLFDCRRYSRKFRFSKVSEVESFDKSIFVLAREGLTKELLAWKLDTLLMSNCNLWRCSQKCGLPHDYELLNLRDKAVLLMGKQ